MMGGAELRNLEGLGCQVKRPVGDLIFIYAFDYQGLFSRSTRFSEPKWKNKLQPSRGTFQELQELFNVKSSLLIE